jgi:protein-L-isoaspartate(D-aspartate) O-methyltransferase
MQAFSSISLVRILEDSDWERLIQNLIKEGILRSPSIIRAMRNVSRLKFLPKDMQSYSAVDTPLPVGFGQTISAPHSLSFTARLGETWFQ